MAMAIRAAQGQFSHPCSPLRTTHDAIGHRPDWV